MEKSLLSDENRPNSDSQIALILKSGSFLGAGKTADLEGRHSWIIRPPRGKGKGLRFTIGGTLNGAPIVFTEMVHAHGTGRMPTFWKREWHMEVGIVRFAAKRTFDDVDDGHIF